MKNILLSSTLCILLTGCASTQNSNHWQGRSLASLIEAFGIPSSYTPLSNGQKRVDYNKSKNHVASGNCTYSFVVTPANIILKSSTNGSCLS